MAFGADHSPALLVASLLTVTASDPIAGLDLTLELELTASGLLRSRAELANTGDDDYQLNDLVLAYPVPSVARELLDLAGHWGRERAPQRREFTVGTPLREGRKGRTGSDAATVLHAGVRGLPGSGESGSARCAERQPQSTRRTILHRHQVPACEPPLPGEVVLAPGDSYASRGHGRQSSPDAVARRFHRHRALSVHLSPASGDLERLGGGLLTTICPPDLAEKAAEVGVDRRADDVASTAARRLPAPATDGVG